MSTLLLRAFSSFVRLLSWHRAQKLGAALGLVWFHLVRIRRKTAMSNLALALPDQTQRHRKIARDAYRHFGISALELLKLQGMNSDLIAKRVHPKGMEHYEAAKARGKGVIVVTAHFGNFDLLACTQAALGIPLAIVSRELHRGELSKFWMETRRSSGLEIFTDTGSPRHVLAWLRSGKVLGLTVDQRTPPDRGGVLADFMGCEVWTTTAPAKLALHTGAALLPVRVERRPDGDHDIVIEPEIQDTKVPETDRIQALTRKINALVGNWVTRRPELWMWLHRRFIDASKTGP
ncbi:MAG: lysophospholipid acyltransferase family protein [Deltaproteobacteria bacterium]|nr:lysophospholipid acyltransferase family protein [Deltaproteobacteria bacterium]